VVVRENTEDVYAGLEHVVYPGVVESIKVVTEAATRRVATFAFELARAQKRSSVSIIHKANIMKRTDGLILRVSKEVGAQYDDVQTRALIVDNACMQMVQWPEQFEVVVCGNLYGDILSDLGAGLVGGISAVWGEDHGEGLVLQSATGDGDIFFNTFGAILEIDVKGSYVVDTGCIVAFDDSLSYKVTTLPKPGGGTSLKSFFLQSISF